MDDTLMPSKPVGGFNLTLGLLYNDSWFNEAPPKDCSHHLCCKCNAATTLHTLYKEVLAFGTLTVKHCQVVTCPECLNEEILSHSSHSYNNKPPTDNSPLAKFKKLSKEEQLRLLNAGGII